MRTVFILIFSILIAAQPCWGSSSFTTPWQRAQIETELGFKLSAKTTDGKENYTLKKLEVSFKGKNNHVKNELIEDIKEIDLSSISIKHSVDFNPEGGSGLFTSVTFTLYEYNGRSSIDNDIYQIMFVFYNSNLSRIVVHNIQNGEETVLNTIYMSHPTSQQ